MENRTLLAEKAFNTRDLFGMVEHRLVTAVTPELSYTLARQEVCSILQDFAHLVSEDSHPIKVMMDMFTHQPEAGSLSAHNGGAWLNINMEHFTEGGWHRSTTPENFAHVMSAVASTFANQLAQYNRFIRNWDHHTKSADHTHRNTSIDDMASTSAHELIKHFGSGDAAKAALHQNVRDVALASAAMRSFIKGRGKKELRKFLAALYIQLD